MKKKNKERNMFVVIFDKRLSHSWQSKHICVEKNLQSLHNGAQQLVNKSLACHDICDITGY